MPTYAAADFPGICGRVPTHTMCAMAQTGRMTATLRRTLLHPGGRTTQRSTLDMSTAAVNACVRQR